MRDEKVSYKIDKNTKLVGNFYDTRINKGIILLPGFTEHRISLERIAKKLNQEFKTWIFDINSQGESTGNWNLNEMTKTTYELILKLKKEHDLKKIGGYGNSIGGMNIGLIAANTEDLFNSTCLTSTPAGLQDAVPTYVLNFLKHTPQKTIRQGTILFDIIESTFNEKYKNKTHQQFKENNKYQEHAQVGALKIYSIKDIMNWVKNAPRLDEQTHKIKSPTLLIYGGEDKLLRIKKGKLPKQLQDMYTSMNNNKNLIIIYGADHSLNYKTKTDDSFNQEPELQHVKTEIEKHFLKYM